MQPKILPNGQILVTKMRLLSQFCDYIMAWASVFTLIFLHALNSSPIINTPPEAEYNIGRRELGLGFISKVSISLLVSFEVVIFTVIYFSFCSILVQKRERKRVCNLQLMTIKEDTACFFINSLTWYVAHTLSFYLLL